ncbi:hypothetical protein BKH43_05750 [Helicobacter sp. 13S00401-1]|uniref:tetratricopeptide repeat protein n=1 Tax=Helicobacter sp. 13S00401-1 TaxID=1905758 RepID=UPI000BD2A960|nr:tetratricopeptide repeat protein [Helicobacter sp. 13S00401-1]PAF50150.1 hypothetical protein BKH43_05750 [Helicobacter sp. 13S00401-1]
MRFLTFMIMIFSSFSLLGALEITLNYGKEKGEDFAVLNLKNNHEFTCKPNTNLKNQIDSISCYIQGIPQSGFNPAKGPFFNLSYNMVKIDSKDYMKIEVVPAKDMQVRLFSTFLDLKTPLGIPSGERSNAKSFQIVAYSGVRIPFLDPSYEVKNKDAINFPVTILDTEAPTLGELDVNRRPLKYEVGQDFEAFSNIKDLMDKKEYLNALNAIAHALKTYKNSLFIKDMTYYAIVALSKQPGSDPASIITRAKDWISVYSRDEKAPEVIYYLALAYIKQNSLANAKYYLVRIISEYPNSRYSPLARMSLANMLTAKSDLKQAPLLYRRAYEEAKDLESASQIAISWALFSLNNDDLANTNNLIEKVLKANPSYFLEHAEKSYLLAKELADKGVYALAARIAFYLSQNSEVPSKMHADMLNNAGIYFAQAKDYDDAHKANSLFLHHYPDSPLASRVKSRDDSILFGVDGSNDKKLARYDYLLKTYPNTPIAKKALELKAKVLYDEKRYEDVIALSPLLDSTSPLIANAYKNALMTENDCKKIASITKDAPNDLDLDFDTSMKVFSCMQKEHLYQKANLMFKDKYKDIDDSAKLASWLYLQAKNLYALGDDKDAIKASYDVLDLAFANDKPEYYDIGFPLFNALFNGNKKDEAIKVAKQLDARFKDDPRLLMVHFNLLNLADTKRDRSAIKLEASRILELQAKNNRSDFSPYADFLLADAESDDKEYDAALKVLNNALSKDLKPQDKQQALYKSANIYYTKGDKQESIKRLETCKAIDSDSSFGILCSNALGLQQDTSKLP